MSTSPLVSVILPFYNAEETLSRAIDSIRNQTFKEFECVLVNNNSTDKSLQIAQDIISTDKRFKLVDEARQGVVFASNKGFVVSKGKYIARMDADDISLPDRLEKQKEFLNANPEYDAVSGLVEYMPHRNDTEGFARYVEWNNSLITYTDIYNNMFVESPIVNPTAMWRRETADLHGMYNHGDFPEDYEMWLRWLANGIKIRKINQSVLKWFDSDTRLTRTKQIYSDDAFFRIKTKYLSKWLKHNNPFHPNVLVWGASKISRKRAALLADHSINILAYIDIKESRKLDKPVMHYSTLQKQQKSFVLVYMKHNKVSKQIQEYLNSKGYKPGVNYLLLS